MGRPGADRPPEAPRQGQGGEPEDGAAARPHLPRLGLVLALLASLLAAKYYRDSEAARRQNALPGNHDSDTSIKPVQMDQGNLPFKKQHPMDKKCTAFEEALHFLILCPVIGSAAREKQKCFSGLPWSLPPSFYTSVTCRAPYSSFGCLTK
ncbi:UNVERIFIED_CONTAM: hypothetical protein K2H54_050901 [Gekko kuhli]